MKSTLVCMEVSHSNTVWLGYLDLTTHTHTHAHLRTPTRGGSRNSGGGGGQGPRKGRSVWIFKLEYAQQESGLHCMPPGGRTSTNHLGKRRLINQYNSYHRCVYWHNTHRWSKRLYQPWSAPWCIIQLITTDKYPIWRHFLEAPFWWETRPIPLIHLPPNMNWGRMGGNKAFVR